MIGAIIGGIATLGSALLSSSASDKASSQLSSSQQKASEAYLQMAAKARTDLIDAYGPAIESYVNAINSSVGQLASGQATTSDILSQNAATANYYLNQGSQAAQAAILGVPYAPQQAQTGQIQTGQTQIPGNEQRQYLTDPVTQSANRLQADYAAEQARLEQNPRPMNESLTALSQAGYLPPLDQMADAVRAGYYIPESTTPIPSRLTNVGDELGMSIVNRQQGPTVQAPAANQPAASQPPQTMTSQGVLPTQGMTGIGAARGDISTSTQQALAALGQGGVTGGYQSNLGSGFAQMLSALGYNPEQAGVNIPTAARGTGGPVPSISIDPNAVMGQASAPALTDNMYTAQQGKGLDYIAQGIDQAVGTLNPYAQTGQQALGQYGALSGALGAQAQRAAQAEFIESPGQQYLREKQEQALLRNAAAIGGLGGGNVRTALQEQAYGIANQQQQQYLENLAALSQQGQAAATQQAGFQTQGAGLGAGLIGDITGQMGEYYNNAARVAGGIQQAGIGAQASMYGANAAAQASMYGADQSTIRQQLANQAGNQQNMMNIAATLSNAEAGRGYSGWELGQNLGYNRDLAAANLLSGSGVGLSELAYRGGTDLANILSNTGINQASNQMNLGSSLAGVSDTTSANIANLLASGGLNSASLQTNLGNALANLATQSGNTLANTAIGMGQAQAAGTLGQANALVGGIGSLGTILGDYFSRTPKTSNNYLTQGMV